MKMIAFIRRALSLAIVFAGTVFVADFFLFPFWDRRFLFIFVTLFALFSGLLLLVPRWHRLPSRFACLVVSTCVALVLVELVFRTLLVQPAVPTDEESFAASVAANWPYTVAVRKDPKTLRIVSLADSFGQAGEENNFTFLLHEKLRRRGQPIEVVNISEWGLELRDELQLLRRFGLRYEPDLLLHSFFVGNDFDLPGHELTKFGGILMRNSGGIETLRPRRFILRKWLGKRRRVRVEEALKEQEFGEGSAATFSTATFLEVERQRVAVWTEATLGARWKWVAGLLDNIRLEAEGKGAQYALVIHPDQYQVDSVLRQKVRYPEVLADVDLELPQRMLTRYCADRQIPCLDLLPLLRAKETEGSVYLINDTHYNLQGNQLVAELVRRFVVESFPDFAIPPGGLDEAQH